MFKRSLALSFGAFCLVSACLAQTQEGYVQKPDDPNVLIPLTSLARPGDVGKFAHTNHMIYVGGGAPAAFDFTAEFVPSHGPSTAPLFSGYAPSDIRAAYGLPSTGGHGVICIIDAYDYPTALGDFNTFAGAYGLPSESSTNVTSSSNKVFQVVYASGTRPTANGGWAQEEALDIEWAHALAPGAKIILIEAASSSFADLMTAEDKAGTLLANEASNSWGGGEFSGETSNDGHFLHSGTVYFASSGDTGGVREWPAASPNVIGCGGTSLPTGGAETAWSGTGCGGSSYEARPSFQSVISGIVGSHRGIADISSDADPNTGVRVYDSYRYRNLAGWLIFGGTSVACPCLAAMHNLSGSSASSSNAEATTIYGHLGSASFHDITSGSAGSFSAAVGWDYPTGVGSPSGLSGF